MKNQALFKIFSNIIILLCLGITGLVGVAGYMSQKFYGNSYAYFLKHLVSIIVGLILGMAAYRLNFSLLKKKSGVIIAIAFISMFLVFLPIIGGGAFGANRWIWLGFTSVQPSEFFKLAAIVYCAFFLSEKRVKKWTESAAFLCLLAIFALPIILQKDLSTLIVLMSSLFVMYFLAETPRRHIIAISILAIVALSGLAVAESYRLQRIKVLFNPDLDPMGAGYHLNQSLITIGSGKLIGVGLGLSRQKFGFLPQAMTDTIFAIIAEEMGFLGALAIIGFIIWLCFQIYELGKSTGEKFLRLICFGAATWFMTQSFINISSTVGLLPITGLPLPFISYGGSAIIAELAMCGIILNISKKQI